MKKTFFLPVAIVLSICVSAQGNSGGKGKGKGNASQTDNPGNSNGKGKGDNYIYDEHDRNVWDGTGYNSCSKPSKNQPAKVRSSFQKDYPYAANVRWTKCRGDWTATFGNGLFRSTAIYHANGTEKIPVLQL